LSAAIHFNQLMHLAYTIHVNGHKALIFKHPRP